MVYKNLAHSCLQVAQGLDVYGAIEQKLSNIFNAAIIYCLHSMTCEGIKTGGDFLQIMLAKVMNMLFGQEFRYLIPELEIIGFTSFDRIATIISAIFDVPNYTKFNRENA